MKKRTLIIIICTAIVVVLGVGGIVYAEMKNENSKKHNEIQVGDYTLRWYSTNEFTDCNIDEYQKKASEWEESLLTYDYEKNQDKYCEIINSCYREKWESSSESYKEEWQVNWNSEQNEKQLTEDEKIIQYVSGAYIGAGDFRRYIGFLNEEHSLDLPRVSYEKVKQYETVFLSGTEGKTMRERLDYRYLANCWISTIPDMEFGSGIVRPIYSLDDNLTKFIIFDIYSVNGPIYVELDETRQNVIKAEHMWPEVVKETNDYVAAEEKIELDVLSEYAKEECDKIGEIILRYFNF